MELISYHHNFVDRVLVRLGTLEQSADQAIEIRQWLKGIDGILAIQSTSQRDQLLIVFDKEKIDANSLLHLLGYSGTVVRSRHS